MALPVTAISLGTVFIIMAFPLLLRKVPPNHWYGLRIPSTFADETVWYEANARAANRLWRLGLLTMAVGGALHLMPIPLSLKQLLLCAVVLGGLMAVVVHSSRFADQLLKDATKRGTKGVVAE